MINVDWPGVKKGLGIPIEEPEDGHFNIAAVSRNDVQEMLISKMGVDLKKAEEIANSLTTREMANLTLGLSNEYFNLHFWTSLQSVFTNLILVKEVSEEEIE
jgi:hypothetical protein